MEEQTQYLYEYQNGKRMRNTGMAKIKKEMDKTTIQIYGKQLDEIKGVLFQEENGRTYIGTWEDELYEFPRQEERTPQVEEEEQQILPQTLEMKELDSQSMESATKMIPASDEEIDEYIPPRDVVYEKIQRQDLSRLPRREWRLANNSFLLHGFYNYHHLLYIEEEGETWIGVPGIFHEKEEMAAKSFGFTKFKRLIDVDIDLEKDEKNTYEDFGYWCRQIKQG